MYHNNQNQHYEARLAGDLLRACQNGTADFLNPAPFPYYTQDMYNKKVLRDAGQLQTLLHNAAQGYQYINYAPTYLIQDSKRSWIRNIKNNSREVGCIVYKGRDERGNKRYEMMSPAKKFNPNVINESPMDQSPIPNIGIYRQTPRLDAGDPKGIEKYITGVIANYFNAAFTKTPYFPPQWGRQETDMLAKAINADPSIALRASQQAFAQASSFKMDNTVNHELDNNVKEAIKQGLPPFITKGHEAIIGPVNSNDYGIPANGIDFANSYYNNSFNGSNQTVNSGEYFTQNGFIPYQTHNESPKNMDKFLVEQYGNMINASLTGTPYSGSISPAELKTLSTGLQKKMKEELGYMSRIVNQAQQNVMGFNYMPYDKDDFINKAQNFSGKEFKMLTQAITSHVNDLCKNIKASFNSEFQKLSKELIEKIKNMDTGKKETTTSAKTAAEKKEAKASSKTAAEKKETTATAKTAAEKKEAKASSKTAAEKKEAKASSKTAAEKKEAKASSKTAAGKTNAEKKEESPSINADTAKKGRRPSNKTAAEKKEESPSINTAAEKKEATPSVKTAADKIETRPAGTRKKGERPSILSEVTEFVKKNIVEKEPALVLADTYLGTMADKAKKIVRTGKSIAGAFLIAANVLAPNLQLPTINSLSKIPPVNSISISVNKDDFKAVSSGITKAVENLQQKMPVKSAARR